MWEPDNVEKYHAGNALFSHVQVGVPLGSNWGLSFGLRPMTRINYQVIKRDRLIDPDTGLPIDSALTLNEGDGGSYLASLGVGHKIDLGVNHSLSFGVNGGYLFGNQEYNTRRSLYNDVLSIYQWQPSNQDCLWRLYFNGGLQYQARLNKDLVLTIGAYGNWEQSLKATMDKVNGNLLL